MKFLKPPYLYHGTSRGKALSIQKYGYIKPFPTGEAKPSISFSGKYEYAKYYAQMKGGVSNGIMLRIKPNEDIKLSNRIANNEGYEYITFSEIPISEIEVEFNNKWYPLQKFDLIGNVLNENSQLIDEILDKINAKGQSSLSLDERNYLKTKDKDLEKWLLSDDEDTFDENGKKLLYNEFDEDEDIFYNEDKLKRVISNFLHKKPYTNNADFGGSYVWNIGKDKYIGKLLMLTDDQELVLLNRSFNEDDETYEDDVEKKINNTKELYKTFLELKKLFR